jgi:hypothetical protein
MRSARLAFALGRFDVLARHGVRQFLQAGHALVGQRLGRAQLGQLADWLERSMGAAEGTT